MTSAPAGSTVEELAAQRRERGIELQAASRATRIPVSNLEAIEAGRFEALPGGPYRVGQIKAYFRWMGLEPAESVLDLASSTRGGPASGPVPLWGVRIAAAVACTVLLALIGWQLFGAADGVAETVEVVPLGPDQRVTLVARRTTRVKVLVDGDVVLDREVPGGEEIAVAGHHRVEVHLEGADRARVEYNDEVIVPQGRQDVPRRLVFIDDLERPE